MGRPYLKRRSKEGEMKESVRLWTVGRPSALLIRSDTAAAVSLLPAQLCGTNCRPQ